MCQCEQRPIYLLNNFPLPLIAIYIRFIIAYLYVHIYLLSFCCVNAIYLLASYIDTNTHRFLKIFNYRAIIVFIHLYSQPILGGCVLCFVVKISNFYRKFREKIEPFLTTIFPKNFTDSAAIHIAYILCEHNNYHAPSAYPTH